MPVAASRRGPSSCPLSFPRARCSAARTSSENQQDRNGSDDDTTSTRSRASLTWSSPQRSCPTLRHGVADLGRRARRHKSAARASTDTRMANWRRADLLVERGPRDQRRECGDIGSGRVQRRVGHVVERGDGPRPNRGDGIRTAHGRALRIRRRGGRRLGSPEWTATRVSGPSALWPSYTRTGTNVTSERWALPQVGERGLSPRFIGCDPVEHGHRRRAARRADQGRPTARRACARGGHES